MGTGQSTVARLESGGAKPSLSTLKRFAQATGARVRITLEARRPSTRRRDNHAAIDIEHPTMAGKSRI